VLLVPIILILPFLIPNDGIPDDIIHVSEQWLPTHPIEPGLLFHVALWGVFAIMETFSRCISQVIDHVRSVKVFWRLALLNILLGNNATDSKQQYKGQVRFHLFSMLNNPVSCAMYRARLSPVYTISNQFSCITTLIPCHSTIFCDFGKPFYWWIVLEKQQVNSNPSFNSING
jgi:hypothetical protein